MFIVFMIQILYPETAVRKWMSAPLLSSFTLSVMSNIQILWLILYSILVSFAFGIFLIVCYTFQRFVEIYSSFILTQALHYPATQIITIPYFFDYFIIETLFGLRVYFSLNSFIFSFEAWSFIL